MNDLKQWLLAKLPVLVPYNISPVLSGTQDFSIKFGTLDGNEDPFNLTLKSKKKNDYSYDDIRFSLSGETPELQSIKRLRKTPFLISSLSYENSGIFIVDFYEWEPITLIYRIFYFQSLSENKNLEIQLPKDYIQTDPNIFKIRNTSFTVNGSSSMQATESTLKIPLSVDKNGDQVFICSLSEKHRLSHELSINSLIVKINKLENLAQKYHILNKIKIQNRKKQDILDELWFTQKGINPDRQLNKSFYEDTLNDDGAFLWAVRLIHYMGWNGLNNDKIKKKYQHSISEFHDNYKFFVDSYFKNNYESDGLIDSLQSWWDQFSLPLYRLKFKRELKYNPSLVFVIYSLSLHLKLPWSQDLYLLSNSFCEEPQIAILAHLNQLIIILDDKKNTIKVIPGPVIAGNVKSLRRGGADFCYTNFGNKYFTSLYQENTELIRIDKEVILLLNQTQNTITVKPNIIPLELNRFYNNDISIQLNNKKYKIPLIWKKAELSLQDCRIRWIFKKDRFQITIHSSKSLSSIKIEDKVVDLTDEKITYYHSIVNSVNTAVIKLLDISGRSYILNRDNSKNTVQLIGWIQDRHGLFVDRYNIRLNYRQILSRPQESGHIRRSFSLPSKFDRVAIFSKKIYQDIPIKRIKNMAFRNLMLCSPHEGNSMILAVLNDKLKNQKTDIEHLFFDLLGFIPFILYKSETTKGLNNQYVVHIDPTDTRYKSENNSDYSKSFGLSLSYPEGLKTLFDLVSEKLSRID